MFRNSKNCRLKPPSYPMVSSTQEKLENSKNLSIYDDSKSTNQSTSKNTNIGKSKNSNNSAIRASNCLEIFSDESDDPELCAYIKLDNPKNFQRILEQKMLQSKDPRPIFNKHKIRKEKNKIYELQNFPNQTVISTNKYTKFKFHKGFQNRFQKSDADNRSGTCKGFYLRVFYLENNAVNYRDVVKSLFLLTCPQFFTRDRLSIKSKLQRNKMGSSINISFDVRDPKYRIALEGHFLNRPLGKVGPRNDYNDLDSHQLKNDNKLILTTNSIALPKQLNAFALNECFNYLHGMPFRDLMGKNSGIVFKKEEYRTNLAEDIFACAYYFGLTPVYDSNILKRYLNADKIRQLSQWVMTLSPPVQVEDGKIITNKRNLPSFYTNELF